MLCLGAAGSQDLNQLLLRLHDIKEDEKDHPKYKSMLGRFPEIIRIVLKECNAELSELDKGMGREVHLGEFRKALTRCEEFAVNFSIQIYARGWALSLSLSLPHAE